MSVLCLADFYTFINPLESTSISNQHIRYLILCTLYVIEFGVPILLKTIKIARPLRHLFILQDSIESILIAKSLLLLIHFQAQKWLSYKSCSCCCKKALQLSPLQTNQIPSKVWIKLRQLRIHQILIHNQINLEKSLLEQHSLEIHMLREAFDQHL